MKLLLGIGYKAGLYEAPCSKIFQVTLNFDLLSYKFQIVCFARCETFRLNKRMTFHGLSIWF